MSVASDRRVSGQPARSPAESGDGAKGGINVEFLGLLLVWFFLGLSVAPAKPLLPVYVDSILKQPPLFTSTLLALQLASGAIGAIVGGTLADLVGRKAALLLGACSAPLAALTFLTHAPALLVLMALVGGLLGSIQTIGGQSYLMNAVRQVRLGSAAALFFIGSTLGTSVGNFIAGHLLDSSGFSGVAVAMIIASGIVLALAAWRLPKQVQVRSVEATSLRKTVQSYGRIIQRREVRLLVGLRLLPTAFWGVATLLVPLLLYRASGHASTAAFYSALSLALAACCQLLTGRIADRVGRRWPAVVLTSLIAIFAIATGLAAHSVIGLYIFGIAGACSAWSLSTLMPGLIKDVSATGEEGRTLALTHLVWSSAMLIGSVLGGWLVSIDGTIPFLIVGVLNFISVGLAIALLRSGKRALYDVQA